MKVMAHSPRVRRPDTPADSAQGAGLESVPEEFVITRPVQLSERGAETLRAEMAEDGPPPSDKLRALLRGVRR